MHMALFLICSHILVENYKFFIPHQYLSYPKLAHGNFAIFGVRKV